MDDLSAMPTIGKRHLGKPPSVGRPPTKRRSSKDRRRRAGSSGLPCDADGGKDEEEGEEEQEEEQQPAHTFSTDKRLAGSAHFRTTCLASVAGSLIIVLSGVAWLNHGAAGAAGAARGALTAAAPVQANVANGQLAEIDARIQKLQAHLKEAMAMDAWADPPQCPKTYVLQEGIGVSWGPCAGTKVAGDCILPPYEAINFCNGNRECSGVAQTNNYLWIQRFPGLVQVVRSPISTNQEWRVCQVTSAVRQREAAALDPQTTSAEEPGWPSIAPMATTAPPTIPRVGALATPSQAHLCQPPRPSFTLPLKACPSSEASCVNNNADYATFSEAWYACGKEPKCGIIQKLASGDYYLRRQSDPDLPAAPGAAMRYFSCVAEKKAEASGGKINEDCVDVSGTYTAQGRQFEISQKGCIGSFEQMSFFMKKAAITLNLSKVEVAGHVVGKKGHRKVLWDNHNVFKEVTEET